MIFIHFLILLAAIFFSNLPVPVQAQTCPDGMIGYWKLDEQVNSQYLNSTGPLGPANSFPENSPSQIQGILGGALSFNGQSSKLEVDANPALDFSSKSSFTIEFWFKGYTIPTTVKCAIGRYIRETRSGWYVGINPNNGRVRFSMFTGNYGTTIYGPNIIDENWHHIAATRSGSGPIKLYVDGMLNDSANIKFNSGFASATAKLNIGWFSFQKDYSLDGYIDEAAIYNKELNNPEIQQHYNNVLAQTNYCGKTGVAPIIISEPVTKVTFGTFYEYSVKAVSTPRPNNYSLLVSPPGMNIQSWSGWITWRPNVPGNFNVTVEVSNGLNPPARQSFTLNVSDEKNCLPGLISYWKMDDTTQGTYQDYVGDNTGISSSPPTLVKGIFGGSMHFNGVSTKINVPVNPTFDFQAKGNFSIEFWYANEEIPAAVKSVIGRYIPETGAKWYVGENANDRRAIFHISDGVSSATIRGGSLEPFGWHHIVAVRNGTTGSVKLYVDGDLEASAYVKFSRNFASPTAELNIGWFRLQKDFSLNGNLDEVALYNTELNDSTVLAHYQKTLWGRLFGSNLTAIFGNYCIGGKREAPVIISKPEITDAVTFQGFNYTVWGIGNPEPRYALIKAPEGMIIDSISGRIGWTSDVPVTADVIVEAHNGVSPQARQSFRVVVSEQEVCPKGISSYWKLDETTPGSYVDFTGTNNAAGNPSPIPAEGLVGGAQQFNGTAKINVDSDASLNFNRTDKFSVEFWYKGNTIPATDQSVIGRDIQVNQNRWYAGINGKDGKAKFYISGGNSSVVASVTGPVITDGQWHHVAATRNGYTGVSKIYVDGVFRDSIVQIYLGNFAHKTQKLNIGWLSASSTYGLKGTLDELAIYKSELPPDDILHHYNNGLKGINLCNLYIPSWKKETAEQSPADVPTEYKLLQNYPNPFNPSTTISYEIPEDGHVKLLVYDVLGRVIATLVDEFQSASRYSVQWSPSGISSSIYFYRLEVTRENGKDNFVSVKKLMLLK